MIVRLPELSLARVGDWADVRVATSRGPARLKIGVGERRLRSRSLEDLDVGNLRKIEREELRLRVSPVDASAAQARGFMDMEGETELWVDAESFTVLEISGHVPKVPGRVVIELDAYRQGWRRRDR